MRHWFIFQADQLLLLKNNNDNTLLTDEHLANLTLHFLHQHAIGQFNQQDCYSAEVASDFVLPAEIRSIPLRSAFDKLGPNWYSAATKAFSVLNWDRNHQYCGRCSNITVHQLTGFERICTTCGLAFYPRISPSIIVLIKKDDHLLMARSPHFTPGAYGLIAGFVEVGESLEDAVHREVMEEVGITIKNLRYYGSQPWPFPDSLMIGFMADHASGEIQIDNLEIEAAGWYRYDNLPGHPSTKVSIASKLIHHFVAEQKKRALE